MQFQPDFLRAGRGQETQRLALEDERGVSGVVNDRQPVLERELHHLGEKLRRRPRPGRIIRVIQHQRLALAQDFRRNRIQVRQKAVALQQRQLMDKAAVILRVRAKDGVARRGHQHVIAGVNQAAGKMVSAALLPME
jgi:PAS domain-containing protein